MRKVGFGHGLTWLGNALSMVGAQPVPFLVMGLIMSVIAAVPLLGAITLLLLGPALVAGTIHASREASLGRKPRIDQLFHVFQKGDRVGSYIALCLPLVAAFFLLVFLAIPFAMYAVGKGIVTQDMTSDPEAMRSAIDQLLFHSGAGVLFLLCMGIVLFLVLMLTFLAPSVILLRRNDAFASMKLSFAASARNFGAFFLSVLLFGMAIQILAKVLGLIFPALFASFVAHIPYYALLGPLTYAMFRDVFGDDASTDADADAPAAPAASHHFEA